MTRIYISCSGDDLSRRSGFVGMMVNPNNNFLDDPVIDRIDMRGEPKAEIQQYINNYLQECSGLILLLGNNTHSRPVVNYELGVAQSRNIPIIVVRIPQTTGGLPNRIQNSHKKSEIIAWDSEEIQNKINSVFGR